MFALQARYFLFPRADGAAGEWEAATFNHITLVFIEFYDFEKTWFLSLNKIPEN